MSEHERGRPAQESTVSCTSTRPRTATSCTTTRNYTDRAPYPTYQKWNAPTNHAKQQLDGPVMRVGDAKANLVTHLEGGEAVCLRG